jgi:hypothetical protein
VRTGLVERARNGDADAFSQLVDLDGDRCYAIAYRILRFDKLFRIAERPGLRELRAGEFSAIPVADAGTYGLHCFRYVNNLRTDHIYLVGPIEVNEPGR